MGVQGVSDGFNCGPEMDAFGLLAPFAVGDRFAGGLAGDGVHGAQAFALVTGAPEVHETVERRAAD